MRTVAPKRQVRDGFGRLLELHPVGYLTGLQTENVSIRPPSRTDHRALYRRKHRINQPAFVRRPRTTVGTPWGQRRNRITPHVLVGRQRGIRDGIGLGRRVGLHLHWHIGWSRLHTDGIRDVCPRVAIGRSRAVWRGRGGVHDEAEDRAAHHILHTGQFGSTECGQGWRNRLIGVAKQSTQGLSRRRSRTGWIGTGRAGRWWKRSLRSRCGRE